MANTGAVTRPPKEELVAWLQRIIDSSVGIPAATYRLGCSYMTPRRRGIEVFEFGGQRRFWLEELEAAAR